MLSDVNMYIISLQPYRFTVESSVILLSTDGSEVVNYSRHGVSTGLSF